MAKINSRAKGCRGERMVRDLFIEHGFAARRGQQFSGSPDSPDVIVPELHATYHVEVKFVENLNVYKAMEQAVKDADGKVPLVFHKKSHTPWHVTLSAEDFFELLTKANDIIQHDNHNPDHTPSSGSPLVIHENRDRSV